jgi:autotransporter-associated beta strand protein
VAGTNSNLIFAGTVRPNPNNNYAAASNFGSITFASAAGSFTLDGNSITLNGNVTNNSSNLQTINPPMILSSGTHSFNAASGNLSVDGLLSGGGNLEKTGNNVLTLNGTNTYSGTTQVSTGTLVINGNQNAATGAVTVSNAGTRLSGTGTVGGATTTIGSGAIHAPGAVGAVGTQTFDRTGAATSNLTYQANSIFEWNIDRSQAQTRGMGYDAVNVTGTVGGTGAIFRIVIGDSAFNQAFWSISRTWTDIFQNGAGSNPSWTSIFGGGFQYYDTSGNPISGGVGSQGTFSFSGNNTLNWVPNGGATFIPEPTSALAGLLIVGGLLRRRR